MVVSGNRTILLFTGEGVLYSALIIFCWNLPMPVSGPTGALSAAFLSEFRRRSV